MRIILVYDSIIQEILEMSRGETRKAEKVLDRDHHRERKRMSAA